MSISTIVLGIVLFAVATMIIYGWGMVRQRSQSSDLMRLLFSKGAKRVKKYLHSHEYITQAETEKICEGLQAKMPFSANKAVVRDKKDFAGQLLRYMEKTGQLERQGSQYEKVKKGSNSAGG